MARPQMVVSRFLADLHPRYDKERGGELPSRSSLIGGRGLTARLFQNGGIHNQSYPDLGNLARFLSNWTDHPNLRIIRRGVRG